MLSLSVNKSPGDMNSCFLAFKKHMLYVSPLGMRLLYIDLINIWSQSIKWIWFKSNLLRHITNSDVCYFGGFVRTVPHNAMYWNSLLPSYSSTTLDGLDRGTKVSLFLNILRWLAFISIKIYGAGIHLSHISNSLKLGGSAVHVCGLVSIWKHAWRSLIPP